MLSAAYPNMREVEEITVGIWHDCLKDVDTKIAVAAIKKYILENVFPPTVADIRKQVVNIQAPGGEILDATSAWSEVMSAMRNYGFYKQKEGLSSLSPVTLKVVKAIGWRELCLCETLDVIRGQFLRMYETMAKREMEDRLLPIGFKNDLVRLAEDKSLTKAITFGEDIKSITD